MKKTGEFDVLKNKGGRGIYICPECIKEMDLDKVKNKLMEQIIRHIQIGWRGRIIKIGYDNAFNEIQKGTKGFLILSTDLAERTKRNILRLFRGDYYQIFKKEELGRFLGKEKVGIIFVPETKFGLKLKGLIEQFLATEGGNVNCQK
ncbi:hypothetical protein [Persephonella sp.]